MYIKNIRKTINNFLVNNPNDSLHHFSIFILFVLETAYFLKTLSIMTNQQYICTSWKKLEQKTICTLLWQTIFLISYRALQAKSCNKSDNAFQISKYNKTQPLIFPIKLVLLRFLSDTFNTNNIQDLKVCNK